jgi:hypothetical protein
MHHIMELECITYLGTSRVVRCFFVGLKRVSEKFEEQYRNTGVQETVGRAKRMDTLKLKNRNIEQIQNQVVCRLFHIMDRQLTDAYGAFAIGFVALAQRIIRIVSKIFPVTVSSSVDAGILKPVEGVKRNIYVLI